MQKLLVFVIALSVTLLGASAIPEAWARDLASRSLTTSEITQYISSFEKLTIGSQPLAYVYHLSPKGYIVISASEELPPLITYSLDSSFYGTEQSQILKDLVLADLSQRLASGSINSKNRQSWARFLGSDFGYDLRADYLLQSSWSQNYPWNMMVPMDPQSGVRSVAGCPAIVMGQILNYLQSTNNTRLDDSDDYYHSYAGRNYSIDDDHESLGFPSFPELNGYLSQIDSAFARDLSLSDSLSAALVFASGTALKQVYSSSVSGTMSVNQAYNAYQRFGFEEAELLGPQAADLHTRIIQNLEDGYPVHLAVVTPSWDAGHNVVVDGYRPEDGMYHMNFGWGGSYNGWYNLPESLPYNLTVVEGAVVDIIPRESVLCLPQSIQMEAGESRTVDIMNLSDAPLVFEDILFPECFTADDWAISVELPFTIEAYGILSFDLSHIGNSREYIQGDLRLVFDRSWCLLPLSFMPAVSAQEAVAEIEPVYVKAMPNPFVDKCHFEISPTPKRPARLFIYNIKGQKVHDSTLGTWDGLDLRGNSCPSGIYFYRVQTRDFSSQGRILKL